MTSPRQGNRQKDTSPTIERVAFQGAPGAYSDLAGRSVFPGARTLPCESFEDAFAAVCEKTADAAMIPIENTLAGRVADVHRLLPGSGLSIVGEHFQPIRHCLLGVKGARLADVKRVYSHAMALPQCRETIRALNIRPVVHDDTAGAAAQIAREGDVTQAALASSLAAEIYGLKILKKDMQDSAENVTRFVVLAAKPAVPPCGSGKMLTAFVFVVRNIPAALYKALGGFATNGVNMMKIESWLGRGVRGAGFYCEVEGHPDESNMRLAFEELRFFADHVRMLGTFAQSPFRSRKGRSARVSKHDT